MTRFVEALEYVSKQTRATVLVVHHANKASMQGAEQTQSAARGSSAFTDGIRWQMNLSSMTTAEATAHDITGNLRHLYLSASITKNNYAAPQPPVFLRRSDHGVLFKADLTESAKRKEQSTVLDIVQKIATSDVRHSARSFAKEFGGTTNIFGMGQNALTGYINQAIENRYLERGGDTRGLLRVTGLGKTLVQVRDTVQ
jgi:RecA-family ATPase